MVSTKSQAPLDLCFRNSLIRFHSVYIHDKISRSPFDYMQEAADNIVFCILASQDFLHVFFIEFFIS